MKIGILYISKHGSGRMQITFFLYHNLLPLAPDVNSSDLFYKKKLSKHFSTPGAGFQKLTLFSRFSSWTTSWRGNLLVFRYDVCDVTWNNKCRWFHISVMHMCNSWWHHISDSRLLPISLWWGGVRNTPKIYTPTCPWCRLLSYNRCVIYDYFWYLFVRPFSLIMFLIP